MSIANDIVTTVLNDLENRSGFDHWWDDVDEEIQDEVRQVLAAKVQQVLDREIR